MVDSRHFENSIINRRHLLHCLTDRHEIWHGNADCLFPTLIGPNNRYNFEVSKIQDIGGRHLKQGKSSYLRYHEIWLVEANWPSKQRPLSPERTTNLRKNKMTDSVIFQCACAKLPYFYFRSEILRHHRVPRSWDTANFRFFKVAAAAILDF